MKPLLFPDNPQFWYETLRCLGHTGYGGADIGEVCLRLPGILRLATMTVGMTSG